jgi:hypothetical protein
MHHCSRQTMLMLSNQESPGLRYATMCPNGHSQTSRSGFSNADQVAWREVWRMQRLIPGCLRAVLRIVSSCSSEICDRSFRGIRQFRRRNCCCCCCCFCSENQQVMLREQPPKFWTPKLAPLASFGPSVRW